MLERRDTRRIDFTASGTAGSIHKDTGSDVAIGSASVCTSTVAVGMKTGGIVAVADGAGVGVGVGIEKV